MAAMIDTAQTPKARPILKWAGGKTQLLPDLVAHLPAEFTIHHEPFVGGGALFFELASLGRLGSAYLSDVNPALIDVYLAVRDCVDDVIRLLKRHRHNETDYYKIRAKNPEKMGLAERAARIIYLNKTCYNGLFRENKSGQFNVPFGRYKNPTICDEPNLRAVSQILQRVDIDSRPFCVL
jgi:DNA adenine methylase